MTTTDYIMNAVFVFFVLRQARERRLDVRSFVVPLIAVFFVAQQYVHSVPGAGNDLALVGVLAAVGLALGVLGGLATHVRAGADGVALARVGWLAGGLLVAGICARMAFAFAVSHGAEPAIRSFSIAHHIGAAAWPVALVSMALLEVTARLVIVQLRGRRLADTQAKPAIAAGVGACSLSPRCCSMRPVRLGGPDGVLSCAVVERDEGVGEGGRVRGPCEREHTCGGGPLARAAAPGATAGHTAPARLGGDRGRRTHHR